MTPLYYVRNLDGGFVLADPQPVPLIQLAVRTINMPVAGRERPKPGSAEDIAYPIGVTQPVKLPPAPVDSGLTTDPTDPALGHGVDSEPVAQNAKYLVLSEAERAKGYVRPYRDAYRHTTCKTITTMARAIAETYAHNPTFYGSTYCLHCRRHLPVGEFTWYEMDGKEGPVVGS